MSAEGFPGTPPMTSGTGRGHPERHPGAGMTSGVGRGHLQPAPRGWDDVRDGVGPPAARTQELGCPACVTALDPATVQRLLLVVVLLCGGCLPGDPEVGGTEVFRASGRVLLP